ncbi:hamartin isoform X1 [Diorhabda carinulata]|uniref:hamartin isoform X1 n=1 Tax=Diorhabda carinulata TaxID=1163345 RepID=UPI0025A0E61A|nr:hamartin isoform X1 [Diorhabda carinulata]
MTDIFERLESNNKEAVENAKQCLREQFIKVNEPWLLNGLYDYYLSTNSQRAMEILVNIKEPHHVYLFDRLSDSLKGQKLDTKVQALTLFGYVARRQPTWLYKLEEHSLIRELLRSLRNEVELLPLISALLVLIVLLPTIPSAMGYYLRDIFEIFSRLASWNCNPGKFVEDQLIHMQVALYALFLRLYGMFPCSFLIYLKYQYKDKNTPVFVHTIKPMLNTVKMHPSLVTSTEDTEVTTERWRSKGVHEIIVECEHFSLDLTDRCPHDSCQYTSGFRSRSGTTNSTIESSYHLQNLKSLATLQIPMTEPSTPFFTPSRMFNLHTPPIVEAIPTGVSQVQDITSHYSLRQSTSSPEAAVEATPETTPVRDYRTISNRSQPLNSNIARALTSFTSKTRSGSVSSTPSQSQPSSPMHKESSPFNFSTEIKVEPIRYKISKLKLDKYQAPDTSDLSRIKHLPSTSSPLRITNPDICSRQSSLNQRSESPVSLEDEEVLSIVSKSDDNKSGDSHFVMQEGDDTAEIKLEEQENGSPCIEGGLHMPNSKSMNNFAKRVQRLRHHSTCNPEPVKIDTSTGSSPGNGISFTNATVRRAVSCPEMKKSPTNPLKDLDKTLDETDEETNEKTENLTQHKPAPTKSIDVNHSTTQTENFWPYEHLFLGVFPSLEINELKPSPDASPAASYTYNDRSLPPSIYDTLDHYIKVAVRTYEKNSKEQLKNQLELVYQHLLFERHRRETHAYRNRRLLADAKSTRSLEECNSALRDTVQLQQKDLDDLRAQIEICKKDWLMEDKKLNKTIKYWENQYKSVQDECKILQANNESLLKDISDYKTRNASLETQLLDVQADLFEAFAELNVAKQKLQQGEKGKKELEELNQELLLIGELHLKYQERLKIVDCGKVDQSLLEDVRKACNEEVRNLNVQLETKQANIEAYRSRVVELEHALTMKDDLILSQKQMIGTINEGKFEKLEALESKYQTQIVINRGLEEKIMELWQRVDSAKRHVGSPDTSSCHEVQVTTTAGLSPHSSPLSASLASSEGSTAFHEREVRNLQAIVDQREIPSTSRFDETEESFPEND